LHARTGRPSRNGVFGLILFDDWCLGPLIGVAVGLIVGAV
jgi:hypothetical protein